MQLDVPEVNLALMKYHISGTPRQSRSHFEIQDSITYSMSNDLKEEFLTTELSPE